MNLKPCPFCGSEQIEESEDDLTVWMQCQHCDARSGGFLFKDRHLVSDEWNTRTPEEKSEEGEGGFCDWKRCTDGAYVSPCVRVHYRGGFKAKFCPQCGKPIRLKESKESE